MITAAEARENVMTYCNDHIGDILAELSERIENASKNGDSMIRVFEYNEEISKTITKVFMRIIDNKHDFYDYLQDPTDTVVFDRRNSFLLTKEIMCDKLYQRGYLKENGERYILIQCGATFWLVKAIILKQNHLGWPENYVLNLITSWKNYNKPNKLLVIESIEPHAWHYCLKEKRKPTIDDVVAAIDHNDYRRLATINEHSTWNGNKKTTYEIPILKASGLASVIDPLEMFCSIEEYFSREKTMAETTEPKGITNDDKITMHGFDTKTSFRGGN